MRLLSRLAVRIECAHKQLLRHSLLEVLGLKHQEIAIVVLGRSAVECGVHHLLDHVRLVVLVVLRDVVALHQRAVLELLHVQIVVPLQLRLVLCADFLSFSTHTASKIGSKVHILHLLRALCVDFVVVNVDGGDQVHSLLMLCDAQRLRQLQRSLSP